MKYIKIFENSKEEGKFWKINTDEPYFEISLNKLKFDDFLKQQIYDMNNGYIKNSGWIFIYVIDTKTSWMGISTTWSKPSEFRKNIAIKNGNKYMGEVEVTDDDIKKWELIKNTEKFNL